MTGTGFHPDAGRIRAASGDAIERGTFSNASVVLTSASCAAGNLKARSWLDFSAEDGRDPDIPKTSENA
jgi:hypothetical protein